MKIAIYRHYEYKQHPLYFAVMKEYISLEQKALFLRELDSLYGDTDQETTDYALEYELWVRMLLSHNALMLNPRYLDMECDGGLVPHDLLDILTPDSEYEESNPARSYMDALRKREEIQAAAGEKEDFEF